MLTLHDYLPSQNGWKVRVLLHLLRLPYRSRSVSIFEGESRGEDFLRLNPVGAVPVLELEDGRALAESNAILSFLAEGSAFLPADRFERAVVMQWLFFEQYFVKPTIGSLRFWTLTGRLARNAHLVEGKREAAERALQALDRRLVASPFLAGDRFSVADLSVYAYSHLAADAGFALDAYAALPRWLADVRSAVGSLCPVHPYSIDPHCGG